MNPRPCWIETNPPEAPGDLLRDASGAPLTCLCAPAVKMLHYCYIAYSIVHLWLTIYLIILSKIEAIAIIAFTEMRISTVVYKTNFYHPSY